MSVFLQYSSMYFFRDLLPLSLLLCLNRLPDESRKNPLNTRMISTLHFYGDCPSSLRCPSFFPLSQSNCALAFSFSPPPSPTPEDFSMWLLTILAFFPDDGLIPTYREVISHTFSTLSLQCSQLYLFCFFFLLPCDGREFESTPNHKDP